MNGNASDNGQERAAAADRAALPFGLLEALKIPCGYERSFKLVKGRVFANRYLLGTDLKHLTHDQLHEICRRLNMPREYSRLLDEHLADANLVFLGFEDRESDAIYKVYLEFWEKVKAEVQTQPAPPKPATLHLGFKWSVDDNRQRTISRYLCHPLLSTNDILQRIAEIYAGREATESWAVVQEIIVTAARRVEDCSFIYLEVLEEGQPRKSFDLNLYRAMLRLSDIQSALNRLRDHFAILPESFDRLMQLDGNQLLGHISGGIDRHGQDFVTVYYEVGRGNVSK